MFLKLKNENPMQPTNTTNESIAISFTVCFKAAPCIGSHDTIVWNTSKHTWNFLHYSNHWYYYSFDYITILFAEASQHKC